MRSTEYLIIDYYFQQQINYLIFGMYWDSISCNFKIHLYKLNAGITSFTLSNQLIQPQVSRNTPCTEPAFSSDRYSNTA